MPLVQPDIKGSRKHLAVQLEAEILLKLRAYAQMCHATPDSVVRAALLRLFEADKQEFDAWLAENPKALDSRRLARIAASPTRKPAPAVRSAEGKVLA
jgi:hypothetical protein